MELVYKYGFGDEDLLGAEIRIYRHGGDGGDVYTIEGDFDSFDAASIPKLATPYKLAYPATTTTKLRDEYDGILHVHHRLTVIASCNPPPETLYILQYGEQQQK